MVIGELQYREISRIIIEHTLFYLSGSLFPLLSFEFLSLLKGLEIPSWTFFNSLFHVDFKHFHFLLVDDIWTKILPKYYREVILKVNTYSLLLNQALEHS